MPDLTQQALAHAREREPLPVTVATLASALDVDAWRAERLLQSLRKRSVLARSYRRGVSVYHLSPTTHAD